MHPQSLRSIPSNQYISLPFVSFLSYFELQYEMSLSIALLLVVVRILITRTVGRKNSFRHPS